VPPGSLWNLFEFVRRMGGARSDSPPILNSVQPTISLGDASGLTTPLLPAIGWAGGLTGAVVAEFGTLVVSSRAAGGTFVRFASGSSAGFGASVGTNYSFQIGPGEALGVGVFTFITLPIQQMGPIDVSAIVRLGTSTILLPAATTPQIAGESRETMVIDDLIYIRPGGTFVMQAAVLNLNHIFNFNVLIQDVPVMIPSQ